jgi:hypothetical protein
VVHRAAGGNGVRSGLHGLQLTRVEIVEQLVTNLYYSH